VFATNDRLLPIGGNLSLSLNALSAQAYLQNFHACQMRVSTAMCEGEKTKECRRDKDGLKKGSERERKG